MNCEVDLSLRAFVVRGGCSTIKKCLWRKLIVNGLLPYFRYRQSVGPTTLSLDWQQPCLRTMSAKLSAWATHSRRARSGSTSTPEVASSTLTIRHLSVFDSWMPCVCSFRSIGHRTVEWQLLDLDVGFSLISTPGLTRDHLQLMSAGFFLFIYYPTPR